MLKEAQAGMNKAGFQIDVGVFPTSVMSIFELSSALENLTQIGGKLVFVFDEFERLAKNTKLDPAFFGGLRSIASNPSVAYVTTSKSSLRELTDNETSMLGSPFFNIFFMIRLGLFEDGDARELISRPSRATGVEFSQATIEFILSLADHQPFFIQVACFHAWEMQSKKGVLTDVDYPSLCEQVEDELQSHLQHAWEHLGEEAQHVLLLPETAWEDPKFGKMLELLKDQGVICRSDNRFRRCALWDTFLKSQALQSGGPVPSNKITPPKEKMLPGRSQLGVLETQVNLPAVTCGHANAQGWHLETKLSEFRRSYKTLTQRIAALDSDIGLEFDSERKFGLEDRRAELVTSRDQIVSEMELIEQQLTASRATMVSETVQPLAPAVPAAGLSPQ